MNQTLLSSLFINVHLLLFLLLLLLSADTPLAVDFYFQNCSVPTTCGRQNISYPFYIPGKQQRFCGYPGYELSCHEDDDGNEEDAYPLLQLAGNNYTVRSINYKRGSLRVSNSLLSDYLNDPACKEFPSLKNLSFPNYMYELLPHQAQIFLLHNCSSSALVYSFSRYKIGCLGGNTSEALALPLDEYLKFRNIRDNNCRGEVVETHVQGNGNGEMKEIIKGGFEIKWLASDCNRCHTSGGICGFNFTTRQFRCFCPDRPHSGRCWDDEDDQDDKRRLKLGLGIGLGGGTALAVCLFILWRCRQRLAPSYFVSRNISSQPYSNSDIEGCTAYFGVPVFSYNELEEATNHFNSEKELGDGGFGTVYHGILKDGREVAVKRLYEHNYKRVEQFMNEIEILTRIRHKNLVSLYGCTSRRSRELLLVYEYIPNGTVADHLHGDRVDPGSLTWPIRMSIAIETASALSYLHASDIVHRDVKTTNILLDNNFCVKVADFGLSRLFPLDVTHVSTAPQGTPGYVDPEYHQCYQLTSKSDVYSFGVVLIELISSMPAVDISRHRHEINLSNLAISKIQKGLFSELVDPYLGFESDDVVRRMIVLVAELAFQCLQQENDMRPTMNEVLEALKIIESGNDVPQTLKPVFENAGMKTSVRPPPSPDCDEIGLLKNMRPEFSPFSPVSVTQQWPSTRSTTPSASI